MTNLTKLTDEQILQKAIMDDFKVFLKLVLKIIENKEPTWVQYEIADFLQQTEILRRMVQAYRGVGKTYITSAYIVWRLLKDRSYTVLVVSASENFAKEVANFIKEIIKNVPLCSFLKPGKEDTNNALQFTIPRESTDKSPSVKVGSIGGQLTGSRADEILVDDIEVATNSDTRVKRDYLNEKIKEFGAIIKPGGNITYLGTPQSQESIYRNLPERGYKVRIWPARYPDEEKLKKYGNKLSPTIEERSSLGKEGGWIGKPTNPDMHDNEDLIGRANEYGNAGFDLQYMLDTSLSDMLRFPLKISDLIVMGTDNTKAPLSLAYGSKKQQICDIHGLTDYTFDGDRCYNPMFVNEDWAEYDTKVMVIDPAGRGVDDTAWVILGTLSGFVYLLDAGGFPGGYQDEVLFKLLKTAKSHKVHQILVESNFGDGMYTKMISEVSYKLYPTDIVEVRNNKIKDLRICDTLEPVINRHKLIVSEEVIRNDIKKSQGRKDYSLVYQLTHISRIRGSLIHDDMIDCLAMGVEHLTDFIGQDSDIAYEKYKEDKRQADWDEWVDDAYGYGGEAGWNAGGFSDSSILFGYR